MKIIQFKCQVPEIADQLKMRMIDIANELSRLSWLKDTSEYVTDEFDIDIWRQHTQDQDLYWAPLELIYIMLGDSGQKILDILLGDGPLQGILRDKALVNSMPEVTLQVVEIEDLIASGYREHIQESI